MIYSGRLPAIDRGGTTDGYVKLTVGKKEKVSEVIPKSLSPTWNLEET